MNLVKLLLHLKPDEIYHLGAQSHVRVSFDIPEYTADITGVGTIRILEAIRETGVRPRFYQASSSEMFGKVAETPQRETTPFHPRSPYACAKVFAYWTTVNYREAYGLHLTSGILFNHESEMRGPEFVTRKIAAAAARISRGDAAPLRIGNLEARRDWGFAGDYVEAMWKMLQQPEPDDYVIATGTNHSVRQFAEKAFGYAGIKISWEGSGVNEVGRDAATGKTVIEIDPSHFRPAEIDELMGDASKAQRVLGWQPRMSFDALVARMVDMEIALLKKPDLAFTPS